MTLRPPRDDEFDAMLELMNAHQLAAFGEADATADDLRTWLTSPSVEIERDIRVLERDGRLIGYADVDADARGSAALVVRRQGRTRTPTRTRSCRSSSRGWTSAPRRAGCGCGPRSTTRGSSTRSPRSASRPSGTPTGWRSTSPATSREPAWPEGISVRTATEDDHRRVYEAVIEVWQDTNDPLDETFEEWAHWHVERAVVRPRALVPRLRGRRARRLLDLPAGPVDPNAGYVGMLGVRRPWRRQGLGEALLLHSFAEFRRRGYTRGTLGVDASSVTGATRLYERAGMSVYRDTVFLERPVQG